jgi:hypothetical protein
MSPTSDLEKVTADLKAIDEAKPEPASLVELDRFEEI